MDRRTLIEKMREAGIEKPESLLVSERDEEKAVWLATEAHLHARIATLEKANADLHSRLDELRRVLRMNLPPELKHEWPPRAGPWPLPVRTETASGRLAERMGAVEREIADGARPNRGRFSLSDPADGG